VGPATVLTLILIAFTAGYLVFSALRTMGLVALNWLQTFGTVFLSILLQAVPFMMIGILISSALHVFVRDERLVRLFPVRHGIGLLSAMFLGLLFPVCECAIVPVMTRLIKKGVKMPIAVTFMLSAPIINPIVIASTLYAFPGRPEVALMRVCFGLGIALLTGLLLQAVGWGKSVSPRAEGGGPECACCVHGTQGKGKELFLQAGSEMFHVGQYLIIGAVLTALLLSVVPRDSLEGLNGHRGVSLLIMMATAFLFSACSTSDAFLAKSFLSRFSLGAVMGFLVFGPMMDVKNLLMLLAGFPKRFVFALSALIAIMNFLVLYGFFFLWP
jgi:uncharacterized membrane protein YraQ (UPF0718 family)